MFYNFRFAFRSVFSRKSSITIILFIAFAITTLIVVNAIFDGTENGIKTVFKQSFTGDIVIREKTKENVSLFGNVSSADESILPFEQVSYYPQLSEFLKNQKEVQFFSHQISSYAALEFNNLRYTVAVFGIEAEQYLKLMDCVKIIDGKPFEKGKKGAMISKSWLEKFEDINGNSIKIGDEIQLVFTDGKTFRIRTLPVSAIYEYPTQNEILDRIILCDSDTIRSLVGRNSIYENDKKNLEIDKQLENAEKTEPQDNFDLDSLFEDVSDVHVEESLQTNLPFSSLKKEKKDQNSDETPINWDFVTIKLFPDVKEKSVIKKINEFSKQNGYTFEAINWRTASGPTAQYIFWLRMILILGIAIVLFAGIIVVNNTLVINIIDRTREIGTMRALGANKRNISFLCMKETLIMCLTSYVLSIFFATFIIGILKFFPIHLHNPFLIQLFGKDFIVVKFSFFNYMQGFLLSLFIGFLSWIVPVYEALKIMPVVAMKGGNT
ncbi:MAG: ABC transporter permease [Treponemataceae bacterium]